MERGDQFGGQGGGEDGDVLEGVGDEDGDGCIGRYGGQVDVGADGGGADDAADDGDGDVVLFGMLEGAGEY